MLIADGGEGIQKLCADEQNFGPGVIDDERDLRPSQTPVDRYQHGVGLGGTEPDLEKAVVILVEKCHSALRTEAGGNQSIRHLAGAAVERAIAGVAIREGECDPPRLRRSLVPHDLGERGKRRAILPLFSRRLRWPPN